MASYVVKPDHLASLISYLKQKSDRKTEVSLGEIMDLAEVMSSALTDLLKTLDRVAYRDLEDIAQEISTMKAEVRNLRVGEMKENHIPDAGRELDAIVEATEDATNSIMEAAEDIMAADNSDPDAYFETVNEKVMAIFEACAFQDITGQRISKVVRTLNFIDERVSTLAARLSTAVEGGDGPDDREETDEERRRRELLLNGPQFSGEGVGQDAVDEFFD